MVCTLIALLQIQIPIKDKDHDEDLSKFQLLSTKKELNHFTGMDIFRNMWKEDVVDGHIKIVKFGKMYFDYENIIIILTNFRYSSLSRVSCLSRFGLVLVWFAGPSPS